MYHFFYGVMKMQNSPEFDIRNQEDKWPTEEMRTSILNIFWTMGD